MDVVLLPVLQQVVAGDVGAVAGADERREAEARGCSTFSRIAEPSAPDWQKNPARPRGGISGDSEALSETSGSVLMTPRQLGPISRSP